MSQLRSNRTFVRLLAGRLVTNAGDSLYVVATMWLVYDLTNSPLYPGLAGFLVQAPAAGQFLVGPLVDRWRLRTVLTGTQALQGVLVLLVPVAAWTGHLSVWVVLVVIPILSAVNQFVYPAQSRALPHIVSEGQLVRANSLFSLAYGGTNVAFHATGGLVVAVIGAVAVYAVDAATFGVSAFLFAGISADVPRSNERDTQHGPSTEQYLTDLRAGIAYVRGSTVRDILLGKMTSNFGFAVLIAVLPGFAASFDGVQSFGLLLAAVAGGGLVGAVSASLFETYPFGPVMVASYLASGLVAAGALLADGFTASLVLFGAAFVPMGVVNVLLTAMLQSSVDDAMLGRITSLQASAVGVTMPVGSLLGGATASVVGTRSTLWLVVGVVGSAGAYFYSRQRLRSIPAVSETDERDLGLHR